MTATKSTEKKLASNTDALPEYCKKPILVLGCGNVLFGDDGFGPRVIEYFLKHYRTPKNACMIDAGTSVRKILFNLLLSEKKPKKIIIIDSVDRGKKPGEIFELPIENLPANKTDDFSMHQAPSSNLLKELRDLSGIEIKLYACQTERIPEVVTIGLSKSLKASIPKICKKLLIELKS